MIEFCKLMIALLVNVNILVYFGDEYKRKKLNTRKIEAFIEKTLMITEETGTFGNAVLNHFFLKIDIGVCQG